MIIRIPPQDICLLTPEAQFNAHYEARTHVPIADIDDVGQALISRYAEFRPGDCIKLCVFDKVGTEWGQLREVCEFRVISKEDRKLTMLKVGRITRIPEPKPKAPDTEHVALKVVKSNGAFEVQDLAGNVLEAFVDEQQANEFKAREEGRARPKAA